MNISRAEIYWYSQEEITNDLNDSFKEFFADWSEDHYEMQLMSSRILFKLRINIFQYLFREIQKKKAQKLIIYLKISQKKLLNI